MKRHFLQRIAMRVFFTLVVFTMFPQSGSATEYIYIYTPADPKFKTVKDAVYLPPYDTKNISFWNDDGLQTFKIKNTMGYTDTFYYILKCSFGANEVSNSTGWKLITSGDFKGWFSYRKSPTDPDPTFNIPKADYSRKSSYDLFLSPNPDGSGTPLYYRGFFNLIPENPPEPKPEIQVPGDLNFGDVNVNNISYNSFRVYNPGDADLKVESINVFPVAGKSGYADFTSSWNGTVKPKKYSPSISVRFKPSSIGQKGAEIYVKSNASAGTERFFASGKGVAPVLNLNKTTVNFPETRVGETATASLTISNSGNRNLSISAFSHSSRLFKGGYSFSLLPGSSRTVNFSFSEPSSPGSYSETLSIYSNDPINSVKTISVSAIAVDDYATISITNPNANSIHALIDGITQNILFNTSISTNSDINIEAFQSWNSEENYAKFATKKLSSGQNQTVDFTLPFQSGWTPNMSTGGFHQVYVKIIAKNSSTGEILTQQVRKIRVIPEIKNRICVATTDIMDRPYDRVIFEIPSGATKLKIDLDNTTSSFPEFNATYDVTAMEIFEMSPDIFAKLPSAVYNYSFKIGGTFYQSGKFAKVIAQDISSVKGKPIVAIHGAAVQIEFSPIVLNASLTDFSQFGDVIKNDERFADYDFIPVSLPNKADLRLQAACIEKTLKWLEGIYRYDANFTLLGYSAGGLAVEAYLKNKAIGLDNLIKPYNDDVGKAFFVAAPLKGTSLITDDLELLYSSEAIKQLKPGSNFLRTLKGEQFPPYVRIASMLGIGGFFDEKWFNDAENLLFFTTGFTPVSGPRSCSKIGAFEYEALQKSCGILGVNNLTLDGRYNDDCKTFETTNFLWTIQNWYESIFGKSKSVSKNQARTTSGLTKQEWKRLALFLKKVGIKWLKKKVEDKVISFIYETGYNMIFESQEPRFLDNDGVVLMCSAFIADGHTRYFNAPTTSFSGVKTFKRGHTSILANEPDDPIYTNTFQTF